MAYLQNITCPQCTQPKTIMVSHCYTTNVCHDCQAANEKERKLLHDRKLADLTIEERLKLIEDWIYHYKPVHVPEPRF